MIDIHDRQMLIHIHRVGHAYPWLCRAAWLASPFSAPGARCS
jgi:hypothetical protein